MSSSFRSVPFAAMLTTMTLAIVLLVVGTVVYGGSYMAEREIGSGALSAYVPMVAMGYGAIVILALAVVELRFYRLRTIELERREARLSEAVDNFEREHEERSESLGSALHDDVGGGLTALRLELDLARRQPSDAAWGRCFAGVDRLLGLVRGLSRTLYPKMVGSMGLSSMLHGIADTFGDAGRQRIDIALEGPLDTLSRRLSLCILRIVQESVLNAARHSNGDRVDVRLCLRGNAVAGSVADNGTGCRECREGLGLTLLRERVRHLGGSLEVRLTRTGGVEVAFRMPAETEEAAA